MVDWVGIIISGVALIVSIISIIISLYIWKRGNKERLDTQRLEFLRNLSIGYSGHNWRFVQYWDFPGVYPGLDELKNEVPSNNDDRYKEAFASRVVVLEHLGFLLQIFTYKHLLKEEDIDGYRTWAISWYNHHKNAMRGIMEYGDTFPVDFWIWLKNEIFKGEDLNTGRLLSVRIDNFKKNQK